MTVSMENPFAEQRRPEPLVNREEESTARMFDTPEKVEFIKEKTKKLIEEVLKTKPAYVIFLDNSARPVSWMMRAAWHAYAGDAPMPKVKFINVGMEKSGYPTADELFRNLDPQILKEYWRRVGPELEQLNGENRKRYKGGLEKPIPIMLVDEMVADGESLHIASNFFYKQIGYTPCSKFEFSNLSDMGRIFDEQCAPWSRCNLTGIHDYGIDRRSIMSNPERNPKIRKKGLALFNEIKEIFKEDVEQGGNRIEA